MAGSERELSVKDDRAPVARAQGQFWVLLVDLKLLVVLMQLHRDHQARWTQRIGIIKAVAASTTIAGWSIWKDYALIWGIILALSQLLDAVKEYLPHQKQLRAASDLAREAERLYIDAQFEWNQIGGGRLSANEIMTRWRTLAKRRLDAERTCFPDGVVGDDRLQALARRKVEAYFRSHDSAGELE